MTAAPASSALTRLVAVLLFAGLPVLAMILAAANFAALLSGRAEIRENGKRLEALSGRLDVLDPKGAVDTSRLYLAGDTPSLAAADLRTRLSAAIAVAGGQVVETRSVEADPAEDPGDAVSLGATFDIDNSGLARLLHALESGTPVMEISDLALRRTEADNHTDNPLLRADLTIKAFRKGASS